MFPGEEPIMDIGVCAERQEGEPDSTDGGSVDMQANSSPLLRNDLHGQESADTRTSHLLMDPLFPTVPLAGNVGQMRFSRVFNIHNNVPITSGTS